MSEVSSFIFSFVGSDPDPSLFWCNNETAVSGQSLESCKNNTDNTLCPKLYKNNNNTKLLLLFMTNSANIIKIISNNNGKGAGKGG